MRRRPRTTDPATTSLEGQQMHSKKVALRAMVAGSALALTAGFLAPVTPATAQTLPTAPTAVDGATPATAAGSCWEIKQTQPAAASGQYWLITPTLQAPQRFYCDMTTDGGGWVLVGRGREGWQRQASGLRTADQVSTTVEGPGAFAVAQLPAATVDGLLDGRRVDALDDGVRLRRASDAAGTTWQETRFKLRKMNGWAWSFAAEYVADTFTIGGQAGSGQGTANFGFNNTLARVDTRATAAQGWNWGWSYGTGTPGQNTSTSYLWSKTNGAGSAQPFTQVYLRPKLFRDQLSFPQVPEMGLPGSSRPAVVSSRPVVGAWGVSGLANGQNTELTTEVQDFVESNGRMYVAGNFRYVQKGQNATGADKIEQPYVAAFDVATGAWISSFRPVLNQQVKALEVLPNGSIAIGGQFTQANGQPVTNFVAVNPVTGATDTSWNLRLQQSVAASPMLVKSLKVKNGFLYVGGSFTHLAGGTTPGTWSYSRNLARVSAANGTPDGKWWASLNGSVNEMDFDPTGSRIFTGGYHTSNGGTPIKKAAGFSTTVQKTGGLKVEPFTYVGSAAADYVQTVIVAGGKLWVGGSEHLLFSYDLNTYQRVDGFIGKQGGDFQASAVGNGVLYASCHCGDWMYTDAYTWPDVGTNWTRADAVNLTMAVDLRTGELIPDFLPTGLKSRYGTGPWANIVDSRGTMWTGGSINQAGGQWTGGFARFPAQDVQAPPVPSAVTLAKSGNALTVAWNGSIGAGERYELLQDGRVISVGTDRSVTLPAPEKDTSFAVRTVDAAGNRSASTPPRTCAAQPVPDSVDLVAAGSTWKWRYSNDALPAGWNSPSFDDGAWDSGTAPLGRGSTLVATDITKGQVLSPQPLSLQARTTFQVADPALLKNLTVTTRADDGVAVYVNGVEVGRNNLPANGAVTQSTYANSSPRTSAAQGNPVTFPVPSSALVSGTNVVAVTTQGGYRNTPDLSMDLTLTAKP